MRRNISIALAVTVAGMLASTGTALAKVDTFAGSCTLTGTTSDSSPERGDYDGTCTGKLNGRSKTYRVKTTTTGQGPSAGPVPITRNGCGVTKFKKADGASIGFLFEGLLTTLQITGNDGGGGSGTATPNSDGTVTIDLDFTDGISG